MTTREQLNRRYRRAMLVGIPGFLVFIGTLPFMQHPLIVAVGLVGFALYGGAIVYIISGGRCLHCDHRLGRIFFYSGRSMFRIARDLSFCPYCGRSLDEHQPT